MGKGIVRGDFYSLTSTTTTNDTTQCRSCSGTGVVFDRESFSNIIYENAFCHSFKAKGSCSNCKFKDYLVQLSGYKCMLDNETHEADYRCGNWSEQIPMYGTFGQDFGIQNNVKE